MQNTPSEEYPSLDSQALQDMGVAKVQSLNISELIGSGILHTKLWVIDNKHFYVGSANMDWRSLTQVSVWERDGLFISASEQSKLLWSVSI